MRSGEEAVKSLDKALCGERAISEATTRTGARSAQAKTVSHFMKATVAIEFLRAQHGEANARKIALKELRRRRARDRAGASTSGAKLQRRSNMDARKTGVGRSGPQTTLRNPNARLRR